MLAGESLRSIAGRTGLSHSSISRHKLGCLPDDLIKARNTNKILEADFLLAKASKLLRSVEKVLDAALLTGNATTVLSATREARPTLILLSTLAGRTKPAPADSHQSVFRALRDGLLKALEPYPAARVAAAAALSEPRGSENQLAG